MGVATSSPSKIESVPLLSEHNRSLKRDTENAKASTAFSTPDDGVRPKTSASITRKAFVGVGVVGFGWLLLSMLKPSNNTSDAMQEASGGKAFNEISRRCDVSGWSGVTQVSAGYHHTVALLGDGTVVATGDNECGECDVSGWSEVTQVSAGLHTVALLGDGTVVATGENGANQCDVSGWSGVTQVSAGFHHTVALLGDGTVLATSSVNDIDVNGTIVPMGDNLGGWNDVSGWSGATQVSAGFAHTVALLRDGTVVATGLNDFGQCDVSGWTGVAQVSAGWNHTVALLRDGTVVAVGDNEAGQLDVSSWSGVAQVSAGYRHTVALRTDGSVVAAGDSAYWGVSDWRDVLQVSAGDFHAVALLDSGTVVASELSF